MLLLAVAIRAEAPLVAKAIRSFGHLRWGDVAGAIALETASMVAFGLMERRILILTGPELPVGRAVALAYASNALSVSLPVVGSGTATAFTYRRLVAPRRPWPAIRRRSSRRPWTACRRSSSTAGTPSTSCCRLPQLAVRPALPGLSIRAVGVHVPWWGIILAWAAGAGGARLNLTPRRPRRRRGRADCRARRAGLAGPDRRTAVPGHQLLGRYRRRLAAPLVSAPGGRTRGRRGARRHSNSRGPGRGTRRRQPTARSESAQGDIADDAREAARAVGGCRT